MKKLVVLIVVLVAAGIGYRYVQSSGKASPEARELQTLSDRLDDARSQYGAAGRAAGMTGMDTTAEASAALEEVKRIEADLEKLQTRLSVEDRAEADRLKAAIREFRGELR